jgi:hypothetical protein
VASIIKSDNPNAKRPHAVRYRNVDAKHVQASFATKREAQAFCRKQETAKSLGDDINVSATRQPFSEAANAWLAANSVGNPNTV